MRHLVFACFNIMGNFVSKEFAMQTLLIARFGIGKESGGMYRAVLSELKAWKDSVSRGPLLLKGGIQTGKTWVLKEFGSLFYEDVLYVDCRKASYISYLVEGELAPERIMARLSTYHGDEIIPDKTLLIFDEVQAVRGLVHMLLVLAKALPEYHICMTGNYVEAELPTVEDNIEPPQIVELFPMNFKEFLSATGNKELIEIIEANGNVNDGAERFRILTQLEMYFLVGGMPKAVSEWIETGELLRVREAHEAILGTATDNFIKLAGEACAGKAAKLLRASANTLKKDNKRFVYSILGEKSSARDYEEALRLLKGNGMLEELWRVNEGDWPPEQYIDDKSFKLYPCDIGLLAYLYDFETKPFTSGEIFAVNKGALTEQFVYQELRSNQNTSSLVYWTGQNPPAKADFLFNDDNSMIPIEIAKAGKKKSNSLSIFSKRYNVPVGIRISLDEMGRDSGVLTIPMYAIWNL